MDNLSNCISRLMKSLGGDAAKYASVAENNARYKDAVRSIWKDKDAERLILESTNAFYVRKDDRPVRELADGEDYVVAEVCVDDSMVRSELDTHRELLQFSLRTNGLKFEELRIIMSKGQMRTRHPFAESE